MEISHLERIRKLENENNRLRGQYDLKLTFADIPQYFITINLEVNLQSLLLGYD